MNHCLCLVLVLVIVSCCNGFDLQENDTEARGKGKYALLTHLAIVLAAKVGLIKIFLAIAVVVTAVKAMVVMAWVLAISKYIPDVWLRTKNEPPHYPYAPQTPPNILGHVEVVGTVYFVLSSTIISAFLWMVASRTVHFFYVVATKLFVLKIVYGIIFYAIAVKAWHFVLWLIHYLKKHQSHDYVEIDHEPVYDHGYYEKGHNHGHVHYGYDYGNYDHGPYGFKSEYGNVDFSNNKKVYDADGSYSVGL